MRLTAAVVAILRRLRAERGVMAFLFILVATTSFLVAVSPRLLDRVSDDGLRDHLARATAVQRNIEFTTVDRIDPGVTPFAGVEATTQTLSDRIPESVQRIIGDRRYVVSSPRFRVADPPNYTTFVSFAYQDGLEDRIAYTAGRPPARVAQPSGDGAPAAIEIALSEETAAETHIGVGDTLHVTVDPGDPIMRNLFPRPTGAAVVDGRRAVLGPATRRRLLVRRHSAGPGDDRRHRRQPDRLHDRADRARRVCRRPRPQLPTAYRWRFYVDGERTDAGQLDALVPDLRRLKTEFDSSGGVADALPNLRTGLAAVVDRYLGERATAEAALAVAALGPLAVAAGALGLIAILIIRRRRAAIVLERGRGASARQLLVAQLVEGLIVTVPAAASVWSWRPSSCRCGPSGCRCSVRSSSRWPRPRSSSSRRGRWRGGRDANWNGTTRRSTRRSPRRRCSRS